MKQVLILLLVVFYNALFSQGKPQRVTTDSICGFSTESTKITVKLDSALSCQSDKKQECVHLNWIILIDGKIPNYMRQRGEFICETDSSSKNKIIPFDYLIGDIIISEEDYKYINNNDFKQIQVLLHYVDHSYQKIAGEKHLCSVTYTYPFHVNKNLIFTSYVVFNIINVNLKKHIFYVTHDCSQYIESSMCILEPTVYQTSTQLIQQKMLWDNSENVFVELNQIKDKRVFESTCRKWNRRMRIKLFFGIEKNTRQKLY